MKVYDIISENKDQDLDEMSGQAVGTILKPLSAVGMWFGRKFGTSFAYVADEVVAKLAAKGRMAGEVTNIEVVRELQRTKLGREMYAKHRDELVRLIKDQSNKYRNPSLWQRMFGKTAPDAVSTSTKVAPGTSAVTAAGETIKKGLTLKTALMGLTAYQMAQPLGDYLSAMERMKKLLDANKDDPAMQAAFEKEQRKAAAELVAAWTTLIVGGKIGSKVLSGTAGLFSQNLAKLFQKLAPLTQQAIMYQLNQSDSAAMMWSKALLSELVPDMAADGVAYLTQVFEKPYEWLKQHGYAGQTGEPSGGTSATPSAVSQTSQNADGAKVDTPQAPGGKTDPAAAAERSAAQKDPANWVPIPTRPTLSTNIKTGDIADTSDVPTITGVKK